MGLAIAMGNVLLPNLLKHDCNSHTTRLTSWYPLIMSLTATAGSAVMVPLAQLVDCIIKYDILAGSGFIGLVAPVATKATEQ